MTLRHVQLTVAAIGVVCLMVLGGQGVHGQQGPVEQFEGTVLIVWGDPHPVRGSNSAIRYSLALLDGQVIPLERGAQQDEVARHFGERVTVTGRRIARATPGVASAQAIAVDAIERSQPQQASAPAAAVATTRKVIYLLVKFSDDAAVPHPPIFFTDLTNPLTPPAGATFPATVNGFFMKTSWSQLSWQGDVGGIGGIGAPGGWLTLPHTKSYYAPCGWSGSCANLSALSADATALGKAQGISFPAYDNINFVLSNDLDCCAWGGSYVLDNKVYGATWEPPWGQETGTYSHELGHSIGLPHSGWVYYAYDSPWDIMSNRTSPNTTQCGSYVSANSGGTSTIFCTEPGDGYIEPHKDILGWIPSSNMVVTDSSSSGTWTLEGAALPLGSALKMIKICLAGFACTGSSARYFTVEARVKFLGTTSQFDNAIPGEGIIIHDVQMGRAPISGPCYFNNQSGFAVPVDATPGDYNSSNCSYTGQTALFNAQWMPGQTYTNNTYHFKVSVVSRSGSTFVVSVATTAGPTVTAPSTVTAGGSITGTVANGPGNALDWVGLYCPTTLTDGAYVEWRYLNNSQSPPATGLTNATVTLPAPVSPTTCNLRLFANDGYTKLATSGNVSIQSAPALSINDVSANEGNSGTTNFGFTVTLSPVNNSQTVTVNYTTADGTATSGSDYTAQSGTLTFSPGVSTRPITVLVTGDTTTEANETFVVNLSNPSNAIISDAQGQGTIVNDDAPSPAVTGPSTVAAGGTITATVTNGPGNPLDWVGLYCPTTLADTAYSDWRYLNNSQSQPATGVANATVTMPAPGSAATCNLRLFINDGFTKLATSGNVSVQSGPALTINDVSANEGNSGTKNFAFTVTLSPVNNSQTVTVNYATANGTATAGSDYTAQSGTLTFAPGVSTRPITVVVTGDTASESDETFFVNLTNASNAGIIDAQGQGTIVNDDAAVTAPATVAIGGTITGTVTNGPGNRLDWAGLYCPTTLADGAYTSWRYLNNSQSQPATGVTSATVTFPAPGSATTCNLRLFINDGYTKLATSGTVTVQ
jgi:hypothetical protein